MAGDEKAFQIEEREGDLFLRVLSGEVSLQVILGELEKRGRCMSLALLEKVVSESEEEWKRIPCPSEYEEEKIDVRLSPDKLSAEITIAPGSVGTRECLEERSLQLLVSKGVKQELVDPGLLSQAIDERGRWKKVVFGKTPVEGVDARLEVSVETDRKAPAGHDAEDGDVDHKDLGIIHNVWRDQEIVVKIPMQEGEDGFDVTGKTLRAKRPRDVKIVEGPNTELSEDGMVLRSKEDGHLVRDGFRFRVEPVFEVAGDVDYSTGDLDFAGILVIHGSIRDGFSVTAGKKMEIGGTVEGARVISEGDINIRSGAMGMGRAFIQSGESIFAGHLEQCSVRAGVDLVFRQAIMHCDVEAGSSIRHTGEGKGHITGGVLKAGTEVECMFLGSEMGTRTVVHVGVSPELLEKRSQLLSGQSELEEKKQMIVKNLSYLARLMKEKGLDEQHRAMALRLDELLRTVREQLGKIAPLIEDIERVIDSNKKKGNVKVWNVCYPGTVIAIRKETLIIREALERVRFIYDEGKIRMVSLE